jgi:hypothetical protein
MTILYKIGCIMKSLIKLITHLTQIFIPILVSVHQLHANKYMLGLSSFLYLRTRKVALYVRY